MKVYQTFDYSDSSDQFQAMLMTVMTVQIQLRTIVIKIMGFLMKFKEYLIKILTFFITTMTILLKKSDNSDLLNTI